MGRARPHTTPLLAAPFAALLAGVPAAAQDAQEEGFDRVGRGIELLLEGLSDEVAPALRHFRDFRELAGEIGDYGRPELLPNGDILIRRKDPLAPPPPPLDPSMPAPPEEGDVDL